MTVFSRPFSICVYLGSKSGEGAKYTQLARETGKQLAARNITLVYGGGSIGLMGEVARAALAENGRVIGIIPEFLYQWEVGLDEVSELIKTDSMHERKTAMVDRSDAFLVLPGGIGTLDELVEVITWAQLGMHRKPIVLVSLDDYWQPFETLINHMVSKSFANSTTSDLYHVVGSLEEALRTIEINASEPQENVGDN
ncbi:MAG: TIGR00730 family Rossman fold protein [Pseudomonadota bacterium]